MHSIYPCSASPSASLVISLAFWLRCICLFPPPQRMFCRTPTSTLLFYALLSTMNRLKKQRTIHDARETTPNLNRMRTENMRVRSMSLA
ncbi:hypothetical protein K469DRAFT_48102 [Zopfia rhizophila CBS 207.26]|uniref:Secreted protein n=1 Tax=Zopfia rhizophila CBS 207.26 TaxID=1314779 RepID=A0A6A6ED62_9PEZI|nr:hypothetical protein K469DRAFT_48102 [Zopfia rhizophila CBS 207.26]